MTTIVRRFQFSAGHRLYKHEGPCVHLHGHNYVVFFHVTSDKLDGVGRIIDFSVLKDRLCGWILEHWDHGFICNKDDAAARKALAAIEGQKIFLMDCNPTAENMAAHLLHEVGPKQLVDTGVRLIRVVLWETENCVAEVAL